MRRLLLSVSIIVCISGWACADAVKPEAGVPYAGGTLIRFPDPSFLFTIPEGYAGFLSPGEDVFVIEREEEEGYMLIIAVTDMSTEDMKILLYQYIPYENNIFLIPTEVPEIQGNRYTLSYTAGYGERAIKGRALAVLNDNGMGVAMFALGPSELMEHYEGILGSIADSLSFMPEE
jgi:opacity protein-like surface antigen